MPVRPLRIVLNGVTGRMGTNQHLVRSIVAIIRQGGVKCDDGDVLMPVPTLTGRNLDKLRQLAAEHGPNADGSPLAVSTDVAAAIADPTTDIVFDASGTQFRAAFVEMAADAGKAIYCEKPTATTVTEALRLAELAERAGVPNGVVQDKLWLGGIAKLRSLIDGGFFGRILSVRGEFGYWVFTGEDPSQPPQRPSWNYRSEDGGGIIIDMFCHWDYVIRNLLGPIRRLVAIGRTDIDRRIDEAAKPYDATADDSAYAIFELESGVICQFNSSWCTRVRRDDLLTIQVDGTHGSALAGLRDCWTQSLADTPRPTWNPDVKQPIDFYAGWTKMPDATPGGPDNAFKIQWELFLKHVACGDPFRWTLREGARGVQLAELGVASWRNREWVQVPNL